MEKNNQNYKFISIILMESVFRRQRKIHLEHVDFKNNISIDIQNERTETELFCSLSISYTAGIDSEINEIDASVKMVGVFECPLNPSVSIEHFEKINAPAIIFPFVREHLASVSMKAGIDAILLPPVNFVQYSNNSK